MASTSKSPKRKPARIFLDCSQTYQSTSRNGIQRVVRNLARESQTLAKELGISCQPLVRYGDYYYPVSAQLQGSQSSNAWLENLKRAYRAVMTPLLAPLEKTVVHRWLLPRPGHRGIFNLPIRAGQLLGRVLRQTCHAVGIGGSVQFKRGDVLMVMEACTYRKSWRALEEARQKGAKAGFLVYDLIALSHSQFCSEHYTTTYRQWLHAAAERADFFLAISHTVRLEVEQYLKDEGLGGQLASHQYGSFPLGADLDGAQQDTQIRSFIREAIAPQADSPVYLYVATLEPRKNHGFLLDAFERAWHEGSRARLCLVARVGWMCDELVERLENHPELGKRLTWIKDASDTELRYCYQNARGLVYPSIVEGFGLPLLEALSHGLLVLASDIPIHREVGGDYCAYFSLDDCRPLVTMIHALDRDPHAIAVRNPSELQVTTWQQSCRTFLTACVNQSMTESTVLEPKQLELCRAA